MRALLALAFLLSSCGVDDSALVGADGDVIPTVFTRPKRQIQGTLAQSYGETPVTSEQELLNAITACATRGATATLASFGSSILIAAPITVSARIVIPPECAGLTIRANSRFPISAATPAINGLFEVAAEYVTIRDLFVFGDADGYFTTFVRTPSSFEPGRSSKGLSVIHNLVMTDVLYSDGSVGNAQEALVADNEQPSVPNAILAGRRLSFNSIRCRAHHNVLRDNGGTVIATSSQASDCVFMGNHTGGGDIDVTVGAGGNTVIGNVTEGGAVTGNVNDIFTGLNT